MRIAILTHNYPSNATERENAGVFVYDFAHELGKRHKVFVFFLSHKEREIKDSKVPVTTFTPASSKNFGNWSFLSPSSILEFYRLAKLRKPLVDFINKNKIDYCLAAWALPSGMFANQIKKELGIPYCVWCLGSDLNKYYHYPFLRNIIKNSLKDAKEIYSNSYSLRKKIENELHLTCKLLPAVTKFDDRTKKQNKQEKKVGTFIFVGRLEKVKGPDLLIEACRLLKKNDHPFQVKIVGRGSLEQYLEGKIKQYKLTEEVKLLGMLGEKDVMKQMTEADFLIIPSMSESLPLVLIEAGKMNLPSIVANVGDCKDFVEKYNVGYVLKERSSQELFKCMRDVLEGLLRLPDPSGFDKIKKDFVLKKSVELFEKDLPSI